MNKVETLKPERLPELEGKENMGYYDSQDPENKSVITLKAIDITPFCPLVDAQAVLKYARITKGLVVQFCDWYEPGEDMGMSCLTSVDLENKVISPDFVVPDWANKWGLSAEELSRIVFDNAPS